MLSCGCTLIQNRPWHEGALHVGAGYSLPGKYSNMHQTGPLYTPEWAGIGTGLFAEGCESMDLGIEGRVALVCASSKGIGRAAAEALAREGVKLALCSRDAGTLEATAESIR